MFGQSILEVEQRVHNPNNFSLTGMFGTVSAISYGENNENTEVYLSLWSYQ
jgi:hypothetical protein